MVCQESVAGRSLVAFSTWHTTFAPLGHPLHPDVAQLEESQLPGSLCSPLKHGVLRGLQGLGHHVQALLLLPALQFLEERGSRSPVSCWGCRWGRRRDRAWRRSPGLPRLGAFCSGQPGLCADMGGGWGVTAGAWPILWTRIQGQLGVVGKGRNRGLSDICLLQDLT